jgi:hypothetical protein
LTPVSSLGGSQAEIHLRFKLFQGNWWLLYGNEWIGYYPGTLFSASGLRVKGNQVLWFGEIVDSQNHAGTTNTDMGGGYFPISGFGWGASMRNLQIQATTGGVLVDYIASSVWQTNSNCYGILGYFNTLTTWRSHLYFGGPGKSAACP